MSTYLTVEQAAAIVGCTPDELLFYAQQGRLRRSLNETDTTIDWQFVFEDVIALKDALEQQSTETQLLEE